MKLRNSINIMKTTNCFILIALTCGLFSCMITTSMRTLQVETMRPAILTIPDSINSVGIFNLLPFQKDDMSLKYMDLRKVINDSLITYKQIANKCTDALATFLIKDGYFEKVRNFGDSINYLKSDSSSNNLFKKLGIDACLYLNDLDFEIIVVNDGNLVANNVKAIWGISLKNDSLTYNYNQNDTLLYDDYSPLQKKQMERVRKVALNSGEYLGKAFGGKVIPSWIRVERMYYSSNNPEMLKAEHSAKEDNWLKAAEFWKKMISNKNRVIAAKAMYNMALCCEMEGNLEAAMDWLVQSYSMLKENNKEHQENCQRYISLLAFRKKEIEKLAKQVRSN